MRTLFLNPPSYEDFDGGAGSRYQAKREVWSFWYPTWLAYPAGMLPGARLLDAPPLEHDRRRGRARSRATTITSSSTPARRRSGPTSAPPQALKDAKPDTVIGFVGGHVDRAARGVAPRQRRRSTTSRARSSTSPSVAVAEGRRSRTCRESASSASDGLRTRPTSPPPLDHRASSTRCRSSTDVYARDLDYKKYNSPYCQYPYVSLYTGRGCPARCTFCLWPQVTTGHSYRTRSVGERARGVRARCGGSSRR